MKLPFMRNPKRMEISKADKIRRKFQIHEINEKCIEKYKKGKVGRKL